MNESSLKCLRLAIDQTLLEKVDRQEKTKKIKIASFYKNMSLFYYFLINKLDHLWALDTTTLVYYE